MRVHWKLRYHEDGECLTDQLVVENSVVISNIERKLRIRETRHDKRLGRTSVLPTNKLRFSLKKNSKYLFSSCRWTIKIKNTLFFIPSTVPLTKIYFFLQLRQWSLAAIQKKFFVRHVGVAPIRGRTYHNVITKFCNVGEPSTKIIVTPVIGDR